MSWTNEMLVTVGNRVADFNRSVDDCEQAPRPGDALQLALTTILERDACARNQVRDRP